MLKAVMSLQGMPAKEVILQSADFRIGFGLNLVTD
jgi:hypothetical protein